MSELEDKLPMDEMENDAPAIEQETPEQRDSRERDEKGRFAAREGEPRGKPDDERASRRYAQERDEARREAEEAKKHFAALQKRLDDMSALARGDDPNVPKVDADPLKPVLEKLDQFDKRFTEQDQTREAEETHRQVMAFADQDEARFRQATPDFPNAITHYITSRLTEMQALGIPQDQAEQALAQEANDLLYQGARSGRSPAETIYAMAKARGYQPGTQPTPALTQTPMPAPTPPQNFGGRSLGSGQGPAGGAVTAAQIAQMSEDDYMAFRATPDGKRAIQRAMSG